MSLLSRWSAVRPHMISFRTVQLTGNSLNSGRVRNASLSAIHRGLRRSERASSQNYRASKPSSRNRLDEPPGRSRNRAAAGSDSDAFAKRFSGATGGARDREHHFKPKKAFKKMREKEEEEGGGRKSRSKRFNNPEYSFGKKSLVYQLNRGELKDKVAKLLVKEGPRGGEEPSQRSGPPRDRSARRQNSGRDPMETSQRSGPPRNRSAWRQNSDRDSMRSLRDGARKELEDGDAAPRKWGRRQSDGAVPAKKGMEFPISIQYSTAASQFLFGRSVVKAALRNSRRKLYQLYMYDGSNKKETKDDDWILSQAQKMKIKVTRISESDQKLLDKMSKGRPHNGLVLEASPLPQLPLVGLGAQSTEPNGYPVLAAHQSKEAAEINGTEGFIYCKPGSARPLVLLLHEILDPGNLGAILRTARFLGVSAVAITQRTSSTITSTVLKAAAGAAEELRLFTVEDPIAFLDTSQKAGWTSYAAVAPAPGPRSDHRQWTPDSVEESKPLMNDPCILVLGNEGSGLPHDVRRKVNHEVTIPRMVHSSSVDSLNVSVATALLCNSFLRGTKQPATFSEQLRMEARKADGGESLF